MSADHLAEAKVRVESIEITEAQIALGQIASTPETHAQLARLAQGAARHLRIFREEQ